MIWRSCNESVDVLLLCYMYLGQNPVGSILFVSSPVSPLGEGLAGGVETTIIQLSSILTRWGYRIGIVAPEGSVQPRGTVVYQVSGMLSQNVTTASRDAQVITAGYGVIERMWDCAFYLQAEYDVIVGMSHDWISYFLSPYFEIPVLHWVSIASTVLAIDRIIEQRFASLPLRLGFYSHTQAETFKFLRHKEVQVLYGAVDLDILRPNNCPSQRLSWVGRISPEKGFEDAVQVAERTGLPLDVCGKMQDEAYFRSTIAQFPRVAVTYHGMLSHSALSKVVAASMAMLVTPKWVEAFGLTVIEAMACGTPVIAYRRGGPAEVIEEGISGYLVEPDDIVSMAEAVQKIPHLTRDRVRKRAEDFSVERLGRRFIQWMSENMRLRESVGEEYPSYCSACSAE